MLNRSTQTIGHSVAILKYPYWKRVIDIIIASIGLIFLLPVMLVIAITILIFEGRPIVFCQPRIGTGGKQFNIWKFRSMHPDAETILRNNREIYQTYVANNYKLPNGQDPRVTKLGRFLRKTSLDELPQLWNVLRGDMSIVGPRPIVLEELEEYGNRKGLFLQMKPGITGVWQVSGRSDVKYPERTDLEISYIDKQGLIFDLTVILKTFGCVLLHKGAH